MLLDSKLVKLSDEVVLLYLAGVWTGHGKEVLVMVMMMLLLLVMLLVILLVMLLVMLLLAVEVMVVVKMLVMMVVILWKEKSHLCYPVRIYPIQCSF